VGSIPTLAISHCRAKSAARRGGAFALGSTLGQQAETLEELNHCDNSGYHRGGASEEGADSAGTSPEAGLRRRWFICRDVGLATVAGLSRGLRPD